MLNIIVAIIFGVPAMVWAGWFTYAGWAFIFKSIIRACGNIHLNHDEPNGHHLIWDYKTKTMYGHPNMVIEKK